MNIFQIPKVSKDKPDKIIGVIDSSGSMEGSWKWLAEHWNKFIPKGFATTITFDSIPRVVEGSILNTNINLHGGGGTNITKAFNKLDEILDGLPESTALTVLFISDGQDNNLKTLDFRMGKLKGNHRKLRLNFLCLGVGADFPTYISMKLREKYHNGDETIPAIFMIEFVSEKAYTIKFEALQQHFSFNQARTIEPPVCLFPWREFTTKVHEGAWVYTYDKSVKIDGQLTNIERFYLDYVGVNEIFRSWNQMMNLESLREGEDVKIRALKTLDLMDEILDEIAIKKGVDMRKVDDLVNEAGLSFKERAFRNKLKREAGRVMWFYNDVKLISEGKAANEANEFEAAKRIGMGTIVGNYNAKVQSLKGFTQEDFLKARNEFIETFKMTPMTPNSKQMASVISLLNQKDVFLEKEFLEGLEICQNQFDLFETFPIVGLAMRISRSSESRINPWMSQVSFIAKHHHTVDSSTIVRNFGSLTLKIGENQSETVNCVLPLFSEEDKDMAPLLKTKLYGLMLTYTITVNPDILLPEAYTSLIGNTLVYLLGEKKSDWQGSMLGLLYQTTKMIAYDQPSFSEYRWKFSENPKLCFLKDEEQLKHSLGIDISKAILHFFCLTNEDKLSKDLVKQCIDMFYLYAFFNFFRENKGNISKLFRLDYLKPNSKSSPVLVVKEKIRKRFQSFLTTGDLDRAIAVALRDSMDGTKASPVWMLKSMEDITGKVSPRLVDIIADIYLGKKPSEEEYKKLILQSYNAKDYEELLIGSSFNFKKAEQALIDSMNIKSAAKPLPSKSKAGKKSKGAKADLEDIKGTSEYRDLCLELHKEFKAIFKEAHMFCIPPTLEEIKAHCLSKGIKFTDIKTGINSLPSNACASRKCGFYLKPLKDHRKLCHHLAIWGRDVPNGFHTVVRTHRNKTPEEIIKIFESSGIDLSKYGYSKNEVKDYIEKVAMVSK